MIIFCSAIGLKILSECNRWHGDGTFSVVPDGFYQLYVIHGLYKSNMLPCVFALLTGKSEDIYKKLVSELKDGALKNSFELKPTQLTIDFEQAVIGAFKYHFPRIEVSGCFFHFGQSLFRKVVEIGLKVQYQEDENLKKYVKKIISLALVPRDKVQDIFVELCEIEKPEFDSIDKFLDYVTETYVDPDQALFPIELWNQYDDNDNKRSNNDIEGYNLWLSLLLHQHPNIWKFIKK